MIKDNAQVVDQVAKVFTIAASICLPASVIYDWGYFGAIDLGMRKVPMSLVDHAKSAVFWFPIVLIVACMLTLSHLLVTRATAGTFYDDRATPASNEDRILQFSKLVKSGRIVLRVFTFFAVTCLIAYAMLGDVLWGALLVGVPSIWACLVCWVIFHPHMMRRWRLATQAMFVFVPVVAWLLWCIGWNNGIAVSYAPATTEIFMAGSTKPELVAIIRYMDKGVLVGTGKGKAEFLQWSNITNIRTDAKFSPNAGLICKWFKRCDIVAETKEVFTGAN